MCYCAIFCIGIQFEFKIFSYNWWLLSLWNVFNSMCVCYENSLCVLHSSASNSFWILMLFPKYPSTWVVAGKADSPMSYSDGNGCVVYAWLWAILENSRTGMAAGRQKQEVGEDSPGGSQVRVPSQGLCIDKETIWDPWVQSVKLKNIYSSSLTTWEENFWAIMYSFAIAAITKYHRLGGLNGRHLFSQNSGG